MTNPRPFATLLPPPTESLAVAYFTPLMTPVPVATRLPEPDKDRDTINGFLRLEAAGGVPAGEEMLWDVRVLIHAYSPDAPTAEDIAIKAVAWGANAQGVTTRINNRDWYVTYSHAPALPVAQEDPRVLLPRYRAMVNWRINGNAL